MKEKLKKIVFFIINPKLLLCFGIAWMITNGWSYVLMGVGVYCGIDWMVVVSGAYLAFLWIPFTPEKIVTVAISIVLLRFLFPKDEKTLGVLKQMMRSLKIKVKNSKSRRAEKGKAFDAERNVMEEIKVGSISELCELYELKLDEGFDSFYGRYPVKKSFAEDESSEKKEELYIEISQDKILKLTSVGYDVSEGDVLLLSPEILQETVGRLYMGDIKKTHGSSIVSCPQSDLILIERIKDRKYCFLKKFYANR